MDDAGDAVADGETTAATVSDQADAAPVLVVSVVGREHVVHLFAGQRYSVETAAGDVVGAMLSEEEFAAGFPDIHADTQTMLAGPIVADIDLPDELPEPGGASPFDVGSAGRYRASVEVMLVAGFDRRVPLSLRSSRV